MALLGGPWTRPVSGRRWLPLYGVLHHVGRRSGRQYSSPVVVRGVPGGVYVPLPFGERTDWYQNARAAGGVRATWRGQGIWLRQPAIEARADRGQGFNAVMRGLMGMAGIDLVVRFSLGHLPDDEPTEGPTGAAAAE